MSVTFAKINVYIKYLNSGQLNGFTANTKCSEVSLSQPYPFYTTLTKELILYKTVEKQNNQQGLGLDSSILPW